METYKLACTGEQLDNALAGRIITEEITATENGVYIPREDVDGISKVTVDVQPPLEEIVVTRSGEYAPSDGAYGFSRVTASFEGEWTTIGLAAGTEPSGEVVIDGITVNAGFFNGNQAMTKLKATNCVFKNTVQNCAALTEAEIGGNVQVSYLFQDCKALQKVKYNSGGTVGGQFNRCTNLEFGDFGPDFWYIGVYFATNAANLKTMVLRRQDGIVDFANAQGLNGTPFATDGTGGTVYVPAALIPEYQAATNWSVLYAAGTCNFVAIEGSAYE